MDLNLKLQIAKKINKWDYIKLRSCYGEKETMAEWIFAKG